MKSILSNIISIFVISIVYFIILRLVALSTYTLFPKFDDKKVSEKGKTTMLVESLSELGLITVMIYIIRAVLIEVMFSFGIFYSHTYENFVIIVLNPALYFGNTDLKKKLDYVLS